MKKAIIATVIFVAAGTLCGYGQQKAPDTAKTVTTKTVVKTTKPAKQYTCTMHPDVVASKPGKCPKCGMKLVAVKPDKKK